jgi:hypothetical protein
VFCMVGILSHLNKWLFVVHDHLNVIRWCLVFPWQPTRHFLQKERQALDVASLKRSEEQNAINKQKCHLPPI